MLLASQMPHCAINTPHHVWLCLKSEWVIFKKKIFYFFVLLWFSLFFYCQLGMDASCWANDAYRSFILHLATGGNLIRHNPRLLKALIQSDAQTSLTFSLTFYLGNTDSDDFYWCLKKCTGSSPSSPSSLPFAKFCCENGHFIPIFFLCLLFCFYTLSMTLPLYWWEF